MRFDIPHEIKATAKITRADGTVEVVEVPPEDIQVLMVQEEN